MTNTQKKRILYQADHRGCKEADIILGQFAKAQVNALSQEELDILEDLLTLDDERILNWVMGKEPTEERFVGVVERIKSRNKCFRISPPR